MQPWQFTATSSARYAVPALEIAISSTVDGEGL
jgi:hypothetical protein